MGKEEGWRPGRRAKEVKRGWEEQRSASFGAPVRVGQTGGGNMVEEGGSSESVREDREGGGGEGANEGGRRKRGKRCE